MYPGILKSPTAEESLFGKATLRGIPVLIGKAHLKFIRDRPMIGTVCVEHGGPPVLVRSTRVGLAGTDLVTQAPTVLARPDRGRGTACAGALGVAVLDQNDGYRRRARLPRPQSPRRARYAPQQRGHAAFPGPCGAMGRACAHQYP